MADERINLGASPYYDRFNRRNNRSKVLFNPDRPLQQSELNELQSIAEHNLRQLGDSMFEDGAMQTGMAFSIDKEEGTLTVEDGLLYLEGKIRQFKNQSIEFTGEGTENIGVRVARKIVDYNEDPTLLDPTQGVDSHLSEGADRLEETVYLTVNDDGAPTIYEFRDGQLYLEPERPEFSKINEVLAERTFDESGSYHVQGFNVWTEVNENDTSKINVVIDEGRAYVLGYKVHKPTPSRVPVNKSTEFAEVINETHTYDTAERRFKVGTNSFKEIKRVMARTESPTSGVQMSKGTQDGRDSIPSEFTSIFRDSTTLWSNSPERVFEYGRDYTIVEENGVQYVNWDTGTNGQEPSTGTTYFITFEYNRLMRKDTDYKIVIEEREENVPGWDTYVDFNGMTGIKPLNEGLVGIDYTFYKTRMDIIVLNHVGDFIVIEGQPDSERNVAAPNQTDPNVLKIAVVTIFPNSDLASVQLDTITRLHMQDLQRIKSRLEDVEYNQTIQLLEHTATVAEDPLLLRGVFVDGFTDMSKIDPELTSIAFSLEDATITLPIDTPEDQMRAPEFASGSSVADVWGRLVSAPFREIREISQPYATEAWNVNPYAVYNKQGVLTLTPDSDNWIETDRITLHETDHVTTRLNRWWGHIGEPSGKLSKKNQHLVDNTSLHGEAAWGRDLNRVDSVEGTMIEQSQETRDEVIEFMRMVDVSFRAENLLPLEDNLALSFDGKRVPITPTGDTLAGSEQGTVRSNGQGIATGKFTIPSGVRTGTREVTLQNADNLASTTFTAQGTMRTTVDIITKTRVTFNLYDPLAQSFAFPNERVVTSVGVYFGSKSTSDNIIMQIRGLSEGGYPNRTVYAERTLRPSDINVSEDASVETKIELDDPLMVEAGRNYCVTFITDSQDYTMWIGTLGNNLIDDPNEVLGSQPYVNGVLFSSSNAVTWTDHQKSDMKFHIYTAEFEEEGIIEFEPMENIDSDGVLLMASHLTPSNTGCFWEVKLLSIDEVGTVPLSSIAWQPLNNFVEIETPFIVGMVQLRATFKANRYMSPFLVLDDLLFVNFVSATEGDYVSLNINAEEAPFNTIKFSYESFTPSGSSVTPYYSLDGGLTWEEFTSTPSVQRQSAEFTKYTYDERVSDFATNTQAKFKLHLEGENRFVRPRARRLTALVKDAFDN